MAVVANGTPNMTTIVSAGSCRISTGTYPSSYGYFGAIDTTTGTPAGEPVTHATANGSNPRIDTVVAYVDTTLTPSTSPANNPGMLKLMAVAGTPNASPSAPSGATIQAAVGAANPYIKLANVLVGTSVTTITNANITDVRTMAGLGLSASITGQNINWSATGVNAGIWWEELGRTTLGASADTLTVNIAARKYLMIMGVYASTGGTVDAGLRFNGDTANNYAYRFSGNGAADSASTSQNYMILSGITTVLKWDNFCGFFVNTASDEKMGNMYRNSLGTTGAGTAPGRIEGSYKWANTSAQITSVTLVNLSGSGDYAIGTELVVLGHN